MSYVHKDSSLQKIKSYTVSYFFNPSNESKKFAIKCIVLNYN